MNLESVQRAVETAAVVSGALSGIVDARRKNLDLVGVYVVGLITAFGGGTLRDVLLARRPLFWVARPEYAAIVLALALLYLYAPRTVRPLRARRVQVLVQVLDAVALGAFGGLGVQMALELDTPPFIAVLFGVMTGTFGGVLRDVVLNEIPHLFQPTTPLYATTVFFGGIVQVTWLAVGAVPTAALGFGAFITVLFRLCALRFGWKLPPPRQREEETP